MADAIDGAADDVRLRYEIVDPLPRFLKAAIVMDQRPIMAGNDRLEPVHNPLAAAKIKHGAALKIDSPLRHCRRNRASGGYRHGLNSFQSATEVLDRAL